MVGKVLKYIIEHSYNIIMMNNKITAETFTPIFNNLFNRVMNKLAVSPVLETTSFSELTSKCGGNTYDHITGIIKNAMMRKWMADYRYEVFSGEVAELDLVDFADEILTEIEKSLR